jgi:hypothetical protein
MTRPTVFIVLTLLAAFDARLGGSQAPRLDAYRVPAGTVLQAKLRTTLGSASSRVDDQVDATLLEAVNSGGIELIPAGSAIHGKVVDATPASPRDLRGRVAVAFFVVNHAATGSRAAIVTKVIAFEAPDAAATGEDGGKARRAKKRPIDVETLPAQPLTITLAEPLTVYIPK